MKLRNKKTGSLGELKDIIEGKIIVEVTDGVSRAGYDYNSITELNEEWEDYEEPKTFWYMTAWGGVKEYSQSQFAIKQKQAIGNYFETKEEAEKAVEKLKAWKRLKDKGFRFEWWSSEPEGDSIHFHINPMAWDKETTSDLGLLFGGEDE